MPPLRSLVSERQMSDLVNRDAIPVQVLHVSKEIHEDTISRNVKFLSSIDLVKFN